MQSFDDASFTIFRLQAKIVTDATAIHAVYMTLHTNTTFCTANNIHASG